MVKDAPALAAAMQAHDWTVLGDKFPTGRPDRATVLVGRGDSARAVARFGPPEVARRTWENMTTLWNSPFGTTRATAGLPEPLELFAEDGAVLMECVAGRPLAEIGPGWEKYFDDAIRLLARLHGCGVTTGVERGSRGIVRSAQRKSTRAAELAPQHAEALRALAAAIEAHRVGDAELVPSHGDFSPRNVLAGGERMAIIDWDRFQMADPARDVAYFATWSWMEVLKRGRMPDNKLLKRAAHVYAEARPTARLKKRLPFHVAAGLMRRACSLIELWPGQSYLVGPLVRVALQQLEPRTRDKNDS